MTGPTPGTEDSRSSFSRQAGEPRTASSMSPSRLVSSFCKRLEQAGDALLASAPAPVHALLLGDDHLDDLAPAGDEIGQQPASRVGQRPDLGLRRRDETGDHRGIDRIGLGALADRLGEGAHLRRIDHHHRQAGRTRGSPRPPSRSRPSPPPRPLADSSGTAARPARRGPRRITRRPTNASRPARHERPADPSIRRYPQRWRPSSPLLALIGLRLRPKRLFGFDGTTDGLTTLRSGLRRPRMRRHPSATAPAIIADEAIRDLQG